MSARARQLVLLSVFAALLLVKAQQPGSLLALSTQPDDFPRSVVVTPAPSANIYDGRAELRVLQLVDTMNAMWARAFASAGDEYERPRVKSVDRRPTEGCGSQVTGWAGVYCFAGRTIVIDIGSQQVHEAIVGADGADAMLGYVLAHEIGHHVQALRGRGREGSREDIVRNELHAECLAGVWGRAAGHAPPPAWSYASDADHGTAAQQQEWLERGHAAGRPADCDAVFKAALSRPPAPAAAPAS
jgi:predicted metalloprotease